MKYVWCLFAFLGAALAPVLVCAQAPLGGVAAILPIQAAKLVADPVRNRVYAVATESNALIVIDTTTFQTTTLATGSEPVDLSISPDGRALYVANSGSTVAAVSAFDLDTLTAVQTFPLPAAPAELVAGPDGRVYILASSLLYQLDTATGTLSMPFADGEYFTAPLQLGPDGKTLFVNHDGLETFDVSTATPAPLLYNGRDLGGVQLVISHNGKYFCVPDGSNIGETSGTTSLYSTADLSSIYGSFGNSYFPGPLAFSLDDSLVYQFRSGAASVIDVFSTETFTQVQEASLPAASAGEYVGGIDSLILDNTGSYLFLVENYTVAGSASSGRQVLVLATGAGTLPPVSLLPVVTSSLSAAATPGAAFTYQITASNTPTSFDATGLPSGLSVDPASGLISGTPTQAGTFPVTLSAANLTGTGTATLALTVAYGPSVVDLAATVPSVTAGSGGEAVIVVSRSGGDPTQPLIVSYTVKGSASAGMDYVVLSGKKKIKPNRSSAQIPIIPLASGSGDGTKTVKLVLTPSADYQLGEAKKAKVKILPAE